MMSDKEVDELVTLWHETDTGVELHEFLGWTWEQYKRWVETGVVPRTSN